MSNTESKINLRRLPADQSFAFLLEPDAEARAAIATQLELIALRKVRFEGELTPAGKKDWRLKAKVGATVVQPCVVTLGPVSTRIDDTIERLYLADFDEPEEGSEVEMPEDDSIEAIPDILDLEEVMIEAIALALPLYPRADDAALETSDFAAPGVAPMTDEDVKPFAGLAGLRDKLAKGEKED
ncbi:YceD family protein [Actibacterium pelagium]|uniref:DUF177 domain-containing protein n=1 Tax=Actibacterium pelagium TaxID=2029103 RepID=A0A917EHJ8_9RHOB|nr:DUF177 domain-containing protein [Actibacterium pelagium]GGE41069.1 hypothetical protein GCM10011517_05890 [Actibacterium pelagium]